MKTFWTHFRRALWLNSILALPLIYFHIQSRAADVVNWGTTKGIAVDMDDFMRKLIIIVVGSMILIILIVPGIVAGANTLADVARRLFKD